MNKCQRDGQDVPKTYFSSNLEFQLGRAGFGEKNTIIRAAKNRFEIEIFLHTGDSITAETAARERENKAAHEHNVHRTFVPILFFISSF